MPVAARVLIPRVGTPYETVRHVFRKGLNNSVSEEEIGLDELSAVENYMPDHLNAGVIIKREGLTVSTSSTQAEAFTSVYMGKNGNYATTSTRIINLTGTQLDSGLTSASDVDWTTMVDNDIFANGTEVRTSTNGSTFAGLGGSPPAFKYVEAHKNLLYGAGHSFGVLRWADLGTVATWTSTNSLTLTNDQNNDVTGLASFRNYLIVLLEQGFILIDGAGTRDVHVVLNRQYSIGCTSNRSIVVTDFGLFWWSDNGPVFSPDGINVQYIGLPRIANTLNGLNKAQYAGVVGAWDSVLQRVMFWVPNGASQSTNNLRLDYFYNVEATRTDALGQSLGSWWPQTGTAANAGGAGRVIVSGEARVYLGAAATGDHLYYADPSVATDNGSSVAAFLETGRFAPISAFARKRFGRIGVQTVVVGNATLQLGIYVDNETSITRTYSVSLSASGFILDQSQLDVGALGLASGAPYDVGIGYARKYSKYKIRISDSNALRTRMRAIVNDGYLVSL